jgi:hypothetical protein
VDRSRPDSRDLRSAARQRRLRDRSTVNRQISEACCPNAGGERAMDHGPVGFDWNPFEFC